LSQLFDEVYASSHIAHTRKHVKAYRDLGIAVIPREFMTKGKGIEWKQYQTRPPTDEEVWKWFYDSADDKTLVNVAAVLGATSGNLLSIDVDGDAGQARFARALSDLGYANNLRGVLLHTMMTRSGSRRGYHILLRVDQTLLDDKKDGVFFRELLRPAKQDLWVGSGDHEAISLLYRGSLAVLAPSVHESGKCNFYAWNQKPPETIRTRKELLELFTLFRDNPETYLAKRKRQWRKRVKLYSGGGCGSCSQTEATKILTSEQTQSLLNLILPKYRVGVRNNIVMLLSGDLYKNGYSLETALDLITTLCRTANDEEEESRLDTVRRTYAKSAAKVKGFGSSGGILDDFR
jgi:hypothetical protein